MHKKCRTPYPVVFFTSSTLSRFILYTLNFKYLKNKFIQVGLNVKIEHLNIKVCRVFHIFCVSLSRFILYTLNLKYLKKLTNWITFKGQLRGPNAKVWRPFHTLRTKWILSVYLKLRKPKKTNSLSYVKVTMEST